MSWIENDVFKLVPRPCRRVLEEHTDITNARLHCNDAIALLWLAAATAKQRDQRAVDAVLAEVQRLTAVVESEELFPPAKSVIIAGSTLRRHLKDVRELLTRRPQMTVEEIDTLTKDLDTQMRRAVAIEYARLMLGRDVFPAIRENLEEVITGIRTK